MSREIKNAVIEYTFLGIEDHGIFTFTIGLKYEGSGQGFGGYALDSYDKVTDSRIGWPVGIEMIRKILEALEVDSWEKLPGKIVRADCEWTKCHGIGHPIKNQWVYPDKIIAKAPNGEVA